MAARPQAPTPQEFSVRVPKNNTKKFSIMRFNASNNLDFSKAKQENMQAKIGRENNLREFKNANDLEDLPKFGAGSEYGREQREEARRKKYGILLKKYNPEDQPWLLEVDKGGNAQPRKFKGTKEGGINDNTSYFVFTQGPDLAFEAYPVEEWYNFNPVINYKYLNSEEAEEEFNRRDKTLNMFSIMLRKKMRNEDDALDAEEGESIKDKKKSKKKADLMLTEMEDWVNSDEEEGEDDEEDEDDNKEKDEDGTSKKKGKGKKSKKKKEADDDDDNDEGKEDSDDGDYDDKEVDYITDSESSSEEEFTDKRNERRYDEKGVVDEEGLRDLNESGESEEETQEQEKEKEDEDAGSSKAAQKEKQNSSSSSSDSSDEDPEEDGGFASALFMQQKKKKPSSRRGSTGSDPNSRNNSRSNTPIPGDKKTEDKAVKRKAETESPLAKKARTSSPVTASSSASATNAAAASTSGATPVAMSSSTEGITEDAVKRYLQRKPMTARDLTQKFKSKKTGLTNEQLVTTLTQILKKLNPDRKKIKDQMYFSIKAD